MEDDYKETVKEFYEIYRPLQKRYNLRAHMHFSVYADGLIEIWEYKGEEQRKRICKVKEVEEIDCYKRAIEYLKIYDKEKREKDGQEQCRQEQYDWDCWRYCEQTAFGIGCSRMEAESV